MSKSTLTVNFHLPKKPKSLLCYLCRKPVDPSTALEVPLTTGDMVYTHKECLDLYLQKASAPSACSTCSAKGSSACNTCSVNNG